METNDNNNSSLDKEEIKYVNIVPRLSFRKVTSDTSRFGRLICWWCKCKYYHVELILENRYISVTPAGIHMKFLHELDHKRYDYLTLKSIHMTEDHYFNILDFIASYETTRYDYFGLFTNQVLGINIYNKEVFCSEFVVQLLKLLGYKRFFPYNGSEFSPQDIYDIIQNGSNKVILQRHTILSRLKRLIGLR